MARVRISLFQRGMLRRRLMMPLTGVVTAGLTIGVPMSTRLGMDPYGAFTMGLGLLTGIP